MNDLTSTQLKALCYIYDRSVKGAHPPTLRELCNYMGYASVGSAQDVIATLRRKGYLEEQGRQIARSLMVSEKARLSLGGEYELDANNSLVVPCLGSVPAGHPREAIEDTIGVLTISKTLLPRKIDQQERFYALRAVGASMQGAGIFDRDWLVIRYQDTADIGQIIVARIGEEVTVKRLMHHNQKGWYLKPENDAFSVMYGDENPFQINGLVVALQRSIS